LLNTLKRKRIVARSRGVNGTGPPSNKGAAVRTDRVAGLYFMSSRTGFISQPVKSIQNNTNVSAVSVPHIYSYGKNRSQVSYSNNYIHRGPSGGGLPVPRRSPIAVFYPPPAGPILLRSRKHPQRGRNTRLGGRRPRIRRFLRPRKGSLNSGHTNGSSSER